MPKCKYIYFNFNISIFKYNNNHFSLEEAINYIPHTEKRKKVPVCEMLEFSGSLSFPMHPIFISETEDNSTPRQLYFSYII